MMSRAVSFARSAKHRILIDAPAAADRAIDPLRRGRRTVLMTPPHGLRMGNLLYLWMQAHISLTVHARDRRVLWTSQMEPWLTVFPGLRELTLDRSELRFSDRRDRNHPYLYQRFGVDFTRDALRGFIEDVLVPEIPPDQCDALVINVRRGDYYSDPDFRAKFGFDQIGYIECALRRVEDANKVTVISDDPDWCREHVDPLLVRNGVSVEYAPTDATANFLDIARSRRIIGTNSTFSYWAAYVSDTLHPDAEIIMPRFHARLSHETDAFQLDPRWHAIPGFH